MCLYGVASNRVHHHVSELGVASVHHMCMASNRVHHHVSEKW